MNDPAQEQIFLAAERNYLAAERTFLAWIRTGLAGLGGSVAMIRLLSFDTASHRLIAHAIGYFLLFWSAGIFYLALSEYERSIKALKEAYPRLHIFLRPRRLVVGVLFLLVLLLLVLFLY